MVISNKNVNAPPKSGDANKKALVGTPLTVQIDIGGQKFAEDIASISLDQRLNDHHELRVILHQADRGDSGQGQFPPDKFAKLLGQTISLKTESIQGTVPQDKMLSFTGRITEVRFENSVGEFDSAVIVAKSPTILLDQVPRNRVFATMKISDAISQILSSYSLERGKVEDTKTQLPYIIQYQETDFDFIVRTAAICGLFAVYDGSKLSIAPSSDLGREETLTWRNNLGAFSVGLQTAPPGFKAASYNPVTGKFYVSDSKSLSTGKSVSGFLAEAAKASKDSYATSGISPIGTAAADQAQLDLHMKWELGHANRRMIECAGSSNWPALRAGTRVKVEGVAVGGMYLITQVVHSLEPGGYSNEFQGMPLDTAYPYPRTMPPTFAHLQTAEVTDTEDPEKLGRIKVKFRWPEQLETDWIRFVSTHGGSSHGLYMLPEIGDEVLVGFEHGNSNVPIAIGSLYNKNGAPDAAVIGKNNTIKALTTRSGHRIVLTDEAGKEKIEIVSKDKKCAIVMDVANKTISITSEGDIKLKGENISIEAGQKLSLKSGADTEVKADANLKQQAGANAELGGSAKVEIKAGATVDVKGAMINLN